MFSFANIDITAFIKSAAALVRNEDHLVRDNDGIDAQRTAKKLYGIGPGYNAVVLADYVCLCESEQQIAGLMCAFSFRMLAKVKETSSASVPPRQDRGRKFERALYCNEYLPA